MQSFNTLLLREWMQHRFGWALLVLVPLGLALLALSVGQVEIDVDVAERASAAFPSLLAAIALAASTAVLFLILTGTSLFLIAGLARRDHADRSIEFWLSLPTSHTRSLAAPLVAHLVLVPIAALAIGAACGVLVSMALVGRIAGFNEWLALPWGHIVPAIGAMFVRFAIGVPLAMLWLMPLILAAVLMGAWLKRWGLPVLVAAVTLIATGAQQIFGIAWPAEALRTMLINAAAALINTHQQSYNFGPDSSPAEGFALLPAWALSDIGPAFGMLLSPAFALVLLVSAALFWLLLEWRRRGASAGV
jgi:ABC-2 type transport system permease protein